LTAARIFHNLDPMKRELPRIRSKAPLRRAGSTFAIALVLLAVQPGSGTEIPELEHALESYRARVEEAALAPHRAAAEALDARYLAALDRALAEAQSGGDLEGALNGDLAWFDLLQDERFIVGIVREVVAEKGHVPIWVGARMDEDGAWHWVNDDAVDAGFWQNPSDSQGTPGQSVMVRWIGSFRASSPDTARVAGYLCRWD